MSLYARHKAGPTDTKYADHAVKVIVTMLHMQKSETKMRPNLVLQLVRADVYRQASIF